MFSGSVRFNVDPFNLHADPVLAEALESCDLQVREVAPPLGQAGGIGTPLVVGYRLGVWSRPPAQSDPLARVGGPGIDVAFPLLATRCTSRPPKTISCLPLPLCVRQAQRETQWETQ
jgi:hypothetical protein